MISGGENGIYGVIVSGIMEGNNGGGYSFVCSNNTFVECRRSKLHTYVEMEKNEEYHCVWRNERFEFQFMQCYLINVTPEHPAVIVKERRRMEL